MLFRLLLDGLHVLLGHIDVLDSSLGGRRRDLLENAKDLDMELRHVIDSLLHLLLLGIEASRRAIVLLDRLRLLDVLHLITELLHVAINALIECSFRLQ